MPVMSLPSIAVIGAGLAGLTCAQTLKEAGTASLVFDKARGPGGRLSSRRRLDTTLDLGCQAITASNPEFQHQLLAWEQQGLVQPWVEQPTSWCALPRMSALTRSLAKNLDLMTSTRIQRLEKQPQDGWVLYDDQNNSWGPFKTVVLATPASQAAPLLEPVAAQLYSKLIKVQEQPLWVAYAILPTGLQPTASLLAPTAAELSRITCLNSKPGQQTDLQRWVIEATPEWSQNNQDRSPAEVAEMLFDLCKQEPEFNPLAKPLLLEAHRWLYGRTANPLGEDFLSDTSEKLYVIGDYCLGSDAEAAWLAGRRLGKALRKTVQ